MIQGAFNTTVDVYRKTNTGTTFKPVWTWASIYSGAGLIDQLSGTEIVRNEGNTIVADHIIYIDYTDVTNKDRLYSDGKYYEIYSKHDPNGMHDHLEIKCKLLPENV